MVNGEEALQLVTRHLTTHATVSGLVPTGGILRAQPRSASTSPPPSPCVVLQKRGGDTFGTSAAGGMLLVRVSGYSRTSQAEAAALYEAVRSALWRERLFSNVTKAGGDLAIQAVAYCEPMAEPEESYVEELGMWCTTAPWRVTTTR